MSRPRFLADNDFNENVLKGVLRREPAVEILRLREVGLDQASDDAVLAYAAAERWIVLSHDVNTMSAAGYARIAAGQPMAGLLLVRQHARLLPTIVELLMIWTASEAEEWAGRVVFFPI
jgi:predicted nuclease of predicted toxin-antitoxin system